MKDGATSLCVRDSRILLVAGLRSRWALPGGRVRRGEAPHEAGFREREEETTLTATGLTYLFQFRGFNTVHHVFFVELQDESIAQPSNEIARCKWFAPVKVRTLSTSGSTRGIVELLLRHVAAVEHAGLRWQSEQVIDVAP
ncbi:NUDIX hydrolase [Paraburkholderia strydomiana]|uniref:NUDIX hydrolase n=1 Tax=Paraburkholderia strydomiana TaxID=1245417 RepID=UPI0028674816|nr:NUDIX domain-containing protein [Paraburkholderia strydomiana]MDR7008925.1 8-oxo-dGTP diphosphatase [Paraburkholderia strydomiana]